MIDFILDDIAEFPRARPLVENIRSFIPRIKSGRCNRCGHRIPSLRQLAGMPEAQNLADIPLYLAVREFEWDLLHEGGICPQCKGRALAAVIGIGLAILQGRR